MRLSSIRTHLRPYSIHGKRKTTINHAFASALAPCDEFDMRRASAALALLGQDAERDLNCVYCGEPAQTWDHLVGLVRNHELFGFGHQIGNLVPACSKCNSSKQGTDWGAFLRKHCESDEQFASRKAELEAYMAGFATEIDVAGARKLEADWLRYAEIKDEILRLMREADSIAGRLRVAFAANTSEAPGHG